MYDGLSYVSVTQRRLEGREEAATDGRGAFFRAQRTLRGERRGAVRATATTSLLPPSTVSGGNPALITHTVVFLGTSFVLPSLLLAHLFRQRRREKGGEQKL